MEFFYDFVVWDSFIGIITLDEIENYFNFKVIAKVSNRALGFLRLL